MEKRLPVNAILSTSAVDSPVGESFPLEQCNPSPEDEVVRLFDQLRNPLLRYLVSFGLTAHDGEEVIQEVFLSLFEHLRRGKSRRNLRGWVFRVAHNLGLKRCRANRQKVSVLTQFSEDIAERALGRDPDPEERLACKQTEERLLAVLRALPMHDQLCLHLRAEGLRYREIARVLGVSLGAVALSLERSLKRLTNAYGR